MFAGSIGLNLDDWATNGPVEDTTMIRGICACGRGWKAADHFAGGRAKCQACGATFDIPAFVPMVVPPVAVRPGRRPGRWRLIVFVGLGLTALVVAFFAGAVFSSWVIYRSMSGFPVDLPTAILGDGETPKHRAVVAYIRKFANDPASVEVVQWGETYSTKLSYRGVPCDSASRVMVRAKASRQIKLPNHTTGFTDE